MAEQPEPESVIVRLEKHRQIGRTIRTVAICAAICFCVWQICRVAITITDKPPWLELLLVLAAPSGLFAVVVKTIRDYTKSNASRIAALERQLDPRRTSSGLMTDGQSPAQEKP